MTAASTTRQRLLFAQLPTRVGVLGFSPTSLSILPLGIDAFLIINLHRVDEPKKPPTWKPPIVHYGEGSRSDLGGHTDGVVLLQSSQLIDTDSSRRVPKEFHLPVR